MKKADSFRKAYRGFNIDKVARFGENVLDKAAADVRWTLAEDPRRIATLQKCRAEVQRKIARLVDAVADGKAPRAVLDQIHALEAERDQLDGAIAAVEARGSLGRLDVARAVRELEPALVAWKDILRGNPVRARQVLKKIVAGPIRMEPLPEGQGYRWQGQLNGGADLDGTEKYLKVRGSGTNGAGMGCTGKSCEKSGAVSAEGPQ